MKVAIILPKAPDFGWIWRVRGLIAMCAEAAAPAAVSDLKIVVAAQLDDVGAVTRALSLDGQTHVAIRPYQWETVPADNAQRMFPKLPFDYAGLTEVGVPRDWGWNFADCDCWILCADASMGAIAPLRPTFIYLRDVAERYGPLAHGAQRQARLERLLTWRQCAAGLVSSAQIGDDLVSFIGMRRSKALFGLQVAPTLTGAARPDGTEPGVLCLSRFESERGLNLLLAALRDAELETEISFTLALDAICLPADEAQARMEKLEAQIEAVAAPARAVLVRTEQEWLRLAKASTAIFCAQNHPGECGDFLYADGLGKPFLGLETAQTRAMRDSARVPVHLFRYFEHGPLKDALVWAADQSAAADGESRLAAANDASREAAVCLMTMMREALDVR